MSEKNLNKNKKVDLRTDIENTRKKTKHLAKKTVEDYKNFAIKGNVVDLAIGVVIGGAFTSIVNSIVNNVVTPFLSVLTNKVDLSTLFISLTGGEYATMDAAKQAGAIIINYGALLNTILNFFVISIALFIVFKYVTKLRQKSEISEKENIKVTTKTCPYCISTVPIEATKCAFCTSDLEK